MGALTKSADTVYALRFITLLTTPWEETNAFKMGLIDDQGKKIKKPFTEKEKSAYNIFHRLVFNIKKLINKVPGGKSKIASYASALYLIKEKSGMSDEQLDQILSECNVDHMDFLSEDTEHWYVTSDGMLSPGSYKLTVGDKMIFPTCEEFGRKGDKVLVEMDNYPVGSLFGLDIYEVIHTSTSQKIHVTAGEIKR